jgi:chromosome segregation ATPase
MPIATTLLALPVTDLVILGVLAAFCCLLGWQTRRFATRGREAALKRSLFEAKGSVPQLESAVRNREQRAETLALELKALKARLTEQEAAARQQELLIAKRDREVRSLNSELVIVKDGASAEQVLLDGDFALAEPVTSTDPEIAKRYAALEARYEAMKRGLIKRDDRIDELEEALRNPDSEVPTRTLEQELSEIEQTADTLKTTLQEREAQLEALQTRLQEEVAERQALEDLAKRRSEGNRELKAVAAKAEQQIPELMKTIEAHIAQVAERDARLQSVGGELAHERRTREARDAELKDLNEQLATATSRQRELQQRLCEQDQARQVLDAELTSTRDSLLATESVVREHELTIAAAERQAVAANERIEAGERTAAALQHTIKDRDFKVESLEAAAQQQTAKLDMLRSTFFEAKHAHKEHIDDLKVRHDAQRQVLDALTAEHDRLRAEATAHETRVGRLEQDIAERDDILNAQRTESRTRAHELGALRDELAATRQTAESLTLAVADIGNALARSRSALNESQCATLVLVARVGAPRLLLPAPVANAVTVAETTTCIGREVDGPAVTAAMA